MCENTGQRGRPATAFYLNRRQALFIITQAGTNTALEITTEVVRKFDAYENGLIQFEPTLEEWRDPRMAAPSKRGVRSGTSPSPAICPPKPPLGSPLSGLLCLPGVIVAQKEKAPQRPGKRRE